MENTIAPHAQKNLSVVAFKLNRRTFALPLDVIVQILPMMTITPIPHLSHIVKGTVNIRGEDVLVISLRSHFNMEDADAQLYTPLLLLKLKNRSLALIVDAVLDVMNLPANTMTGMRNMLPDGVENLPMLQGVSYFNNDTILVLDPANLFYNHRTLLQQIQVETRYDPPIQGVPIDEALDTLLSKAPPPAPAEEKKPAENKNAGAPKAKPAEAAAPVEKAAPVETAPPVEKEKPAETAAPAEKAKPVEAAAPVEKAKPAETAAPKEKNAEKASKDKPAKGDK